MKEKFPVTFEIKIEGCNNRTWQGKVLMAQEEIVPFKSDLELLLIIDRLVIEKPKFHVSSAFSDIWNTAEGVNQHGVKYKV